MTEEEEFERILDSIERYGQMDPDDVEEDEYARLLARYDELRRKGHGPQPYRGAEQE
jgi:Asp-tRNA(Asn)/Glu-tRNA(Gln) amidotransferase C subunit